MNGITPVLFHLPDMKTAICHGDRIFIAEGEKDCLNLWGIGLVATCNSGGAGKWRPEYSECLRGGHIVIVPDNDPAGYAHAIQVGNSLYGMAASLKVLKIPAPYKDFSEWLPDHDWIQFDDLIEKAFDYRPGIALNISARGARL